MTLTNYFLYVYFFFKGLRFKKVTNVSKRFFFKERTCPALLSSASSPCIFSVNVQLFRVCFFFSVALALAQSLYISSSVPVTSPF